MPDSAPPSADDLLLAQLADLLAGPRPRWAEAKALADRVGPDNPALRGRVEALFRLYEGISGRPRSGRLRGLLKDRRTWLAVAGVAGLLVGALALPRAGQPAATAGPDAAPERIEALQQFQYPKAPYNLGQFKTLYVVPARGKVTVDGDLSDWDLSGTFRSGCDPAGGGLFYVEGRMMADRKNLYIAAHVGDPSPLCSRMAPTAAGDPEGWKGGGLQVRLATRADLGWPLTADEKDAGEHFAHLTLWYYQPQHQPCLHLAFGMDLHGGTTLTHPNGFEGAYRKDADGRGYVLEYAVPWQLLKAAPPADGSRMGLNWSVLWSDEKGSDWRAKLVDLINPDYRPNETTVATYQKAATWGQGVYLLGAK